MHTCVWRMHSAKSKIKKIGRVPTLCRLPFYILLNTSSWRLYTCSLQDVKVISKLEEGNMYIHSWSTLEVTGSDSTHVASHKTDEQAHSTMLAYESEMSHSHLVSADTGHQSQLQYKHAPQLRHYCLSCRTDMQAHTSHRTSQGLTPAT